MYHQDRWGGKTRNNSTEARKMMEKKRRMDGRTAARSLARYHLPFRNRRRITQRCKGWTGGRRGRWDDQWFRKKSALALSWGDPKGRAFESKWRGGTGSWGLEDEKKKGSPILSKDSKRPKRKASRSKDDQAANTGVVLLLLSAQPRWN